MTKLDFTKPLKTRDGKEVRIYATDGAEEYEPIHGAVLIDGGWNQTKWDEYGRSQIHGTTDSRDLVQDTTKKLVGYVNIYSDCEPGDKVHLTRYRADNNVLVHKERVACKRIEIKYEEGDFDE